MFSGIRKHLNILGEKFNSNLFRDTQGFSAIGLEPVGAFYVVRHALQAPNTALETSVFCFSALLSSVCSVYICGTRPIECG